jgi:hypothetical protein
MESKMTIKESSMGVIGVRSNKSDWDMIVAGVFVCLERLSYGMDIVSFWETYVLPLRRISRRFFNNMCLEDVAKHMYFHGDIVLSGRNPQDFENRYVVLPLNACKLAMGMGSISNAVVRINEFESSTLLEMSQLVTEKQARILYLSPSELPVKKMELIKEIMPKWQSITGSFSITLQCYKLLANEILPFIPNIKCCELVDYGKASIEELSYLSTFVPLECLSIDDARVETKPSSISHLLYDIYHYMPPLEDDDYEDSTSFDPLGCWTKCHTKRITVVGVKHFVRTIAPIVSWTIENKRLFPVDILELLYNHSDPLAKDKYANVVIPTINETISPRKLTIDIIRPYLTNEENLNLTSLAVSTMAPVVLRIAVFDTKLFSCMRDVPMFHSVTKLSIGNLVGQDQWNALKRFDHLRHLKIKVVDTPRPFDIIHDMNTIVEFTYGDTYKPVKNTKLLHVIPNITSLRRLCLKNICSLKKTLNDLSSWSTEKFSPGMDVSISIAPCTWIRPKDFLNLLLLFPDANSVRCTTVDEPLLYSLLHFSMPMDIPPLNLHPPTCIQCDAGLVVHALTWCKQGGVVITDMSDTGFFGIGHHICTFNTQRECIIKIVQEMKKAKVAYVAQSKAKTLVLKNCDIISSGILESVLKALSQLDTTSLEEIILYVWHQEYVDTLLMLVWGIAALRPSSASPMKITIRIKQKNAASRLISLLNIGETATTFVTDYFFITKQSPTAQQKEMIMNAAKHLGFNMALSKTF